MRILKYFKLFIIILFLFLNGISNTTSAKKIPNLKFNQNGKFKIVQFTDIHFIEYHQRKRDSVINIMKTILAAEKPDLVVLTGDIALSDNMKAGWEIITRPMANAKIPWAAVFGNHDPEHGHTNKEIMDFLQTLPYNCSKPGPIKVSGVGNYVLEIKGSTGKQVKALLYCLDSHTKTGAKRGSELGEYDWIKFDQIEWYRKTSKKYTKRNNGKPLPALTFFHIPLPEYKIVSNKKTTVGVKFEKVASPVINSGMFNAFFEEKDVMGVFVGHDHVNNYIGTLNDICLAYGCKTGLESYGNLEKGARIIELYEGERKFDSWIHTLNNTKQYFVTYPETFKEK